MKKLLFMYPIGGYHYFGNLTEKDRDRLSQVLDKRYREKGYQVCFLNFKDVPFSDLYFVKAGDSIISGTLDFKWNIGSDRIKLYCSTGRAKLLDHFDYPSFEAIVDELGSLEKLFVAGQEPYGILLSFTKYMKERGCDVEIDRELSNFFPKYSKNYGFSFDTYNPANLVINDEIHCLYTQDISLHKCFHSLISENPIYRTQEYEATISRFDTYFYRVCSDSSFHLEKQKKVIDKLYYLFSTFTEKENIEVINKLFFHYREYVDFLFQMCSYSGSDQFPMVKEVLDSCISFLEDSFVGRNFKMKRYK